MFLSIEGTAVSSFFVFLRINLSIYIFFHYLCSVKLIPKDDRFLFVF